MSQNDNPKTAAIDRPDIEWGGFSVTQNGMQVAGGSGPYEDCKREAAHYAMVYRQDGPVRTRVWRNRRKATAA